MIKKGSASTLRVGGGTPPSNTHPLGLLTQPLNLASPQNYFLDRTLNLILIYIQTLCKHFVTSSSVVHCWFISGSLLVHQWFIAGSSVVHCWFISGSLLVHQWFIAGIHLMQYNHCVGIISRQNHRYTAA